jgi:glycosyltransferase involved in cell wall biosynthesis
VPSSRADSRLTVAAIHLGFFYAGGGERLVLEQVLGLRRLGHDVELFAPIVDREACYPELIDRVGVHVLVPRPPDWLPGRVAVAVLAACLLAPLLVLRLRRFDVILAANQPSLWIAWVARAVLGTPYIGYLAQPNRVLYPRDADRAFSHPNLDYRLFRLMARALRPLVDWTDRISVAGASEILANGAYMARVLRRIYGRAAEPCPAGTEAAPRPIEPPQRHRGEIHVHQRTIPKPYVLLTNRHFEVKRFDYAIRALTASQHAHLVVTGAFTAYTEQMRRLAEDLGVADRVFFAGLVSESTLNRLYEEAAVYVYPAPEEDYGMGIIEAMGHAVPVVAWDAAGPTSTVEPDETGILVKPFDEERFAEALRTLLENPNRAARMGHAGWLKVADGLSSDSHYRHLAAVLARAVSRSRAGLLSQPLRRN